MSGKIWLSRCVFDHRLFRGEVFSSREAWIWLVAEAAWQPIKTRDGDLERGQLFTAERFLAKAWHWEKTKVRRLLQNLESDGMIARETRTSGTIITILNYEKYQAKAAPQTAPQTDHETHRKPHRVSRQDDCKISDTRTTDEPQTAPQTAPPDAPNLNKGIPNKSGGAHAPTPRSVLLTVLNPDHADALIKHRQSQRKPFSLRGAQILAKKLQDSPHDANAIADLMIEKVWLSFEDDYEAVKRLGIGPAKASLPLDWPLTAPPENVYAAWARGDWLSQHWGPRPDSPGCWVPPHYLDEWKRRIVAQGEQPNGTEQAA